jgi:hypothetical protein
MLVKLQNHDVEFNVAQDVPKEKWTPYLFLVIAHPHRYLGLSWDVPKDGSAFTLEHAFSYASQIGFQPTEDGQGMRVGGHRMVIPFEGLSPLRQIIVANYTGLVAVGAEPDESMMKKTLVEGYLQFIDPPKIIRPPVGGNGGNIQKPR